MADGHFLGWPRPGRKLSRARLRRQ